MSVEEEVTNFIVENFLFGEDRGLRRDTSFLDGGVIDSTGMMQLVGYISERFALLVRDEEIVPENLDSIARVTAFIAKKRAVGEVLTRLPTSAT